MASLGVITGSGYYSFAEAAAASRSVPTPWGAAEIHAVERDGWEILSIARHGTRHQRLSSQVEHRANLWALGQAGAAAVIGTTSVGVLDPALPLGRPILFDDLFFPSNRLPDGSMATFFIEPGDPRRGHWIPETPFSPALRELLRVAAAAAGIEIVDRGCYVHADGPRFNTAAEHRWMRSVGGVAVSQTCGPEAVLAGELGIPYALVGFGVNRATAASEQEQSASLVDLLASHRSVVGALLDALVAVLHRRGAPPCDTGRVFRIET